MEFPTKVTIKKDGQPVARLAFGQPDDILDSPHADDLIHRLEKERFVYHPALGLNHYPDMMPKDDPRWWFTHIADSVWPEYTIEAME